MVNILGIVISTIIVVIIGGGGFFLLWKMTRPKKITWNAKVYQLGEGVKPLVKDKEGRIISDVRLSDLRPYTLDIVEKIEKDPGITIFRLQKLNRVVPAVTTDCVDYWGEKNKEVSVLIEGESCTLLKKGYDRKTGTKIFNPLPFSRTNMIKGEMAIRKDRLRKEKDILQAITPWIVAGICMLGLITIVYMTVDGYVEISENNERAAKYQSDKIVEAATIMKGLPGYREVKEETQPTEAPPPLES